MATKLSPHLLVKIPSYGETFIYSLVRLVLLFPAWQILIEPTVKNHNCSSEWPYRLVDSSEVFDVIIDVLSKLLGWVNGIEKLGTVSSAWLKKQLPVICYQTWIVAGAWIVWVCMSHFSVEGNGRRLVTVIRSTWESAWAESPLGVWVNQHQRK